MRPAIQQPPSRSQQWRELRRLIDNGASLSNDSLWHHRTYKVGIRYILDLKALYDDAKIHNQLPSPSEPRFSPLMSTKKNAMRQFWDWYETYPEDASFGRDWAINSVIFGMPVGRTPDAYNTLSRVTQPARKKLARAALACPIGLLRRAPEELCDWATQHLAGTYAVNRTPEWKAWEEARTDVEVLKELWVRPQGYMQTLRAVRLKIGDGELAPLPYQGLDMSHPYGPDMTDSKEESTMSDPLLPLPA
ncbi:hypothetical protein EJ08DRAFT_699183 [Tothia fuscella]|uniref:Uncharacterized protein n=1 Tax=Tothia fuscella TaxID=1048955 RepID=A0A9P4NN28_9PEZI|nr:hypothetical protein EJ08DRAFT_699183 [Tothia fuscella]